MVCGSLTSKALPAGGVSFTNTGGEPEEESKFTVFIKNCKETLQVKKSKFLNHDYFVLRFQQKNAMLLKIIFSKDFHSACLQWDY